MILGQEEISKNTIDVLNLNSHPLQKKRESILDECKRLCAYTNKEEVRKLYIGPQSGQLPPYSEMVEYFMKKGLFDDSDLLKEFIGK